MELVLFYEKVYYRPIMKCPLCHCTQSELYFEIKEKHFKMYVLRTYFECNNCNLVYLDPSQRLGPEKEKARYDVHENTTEQAGYYSFLMQMWEPLQKVILANSKGLDFGCGPTKALADLMVKDGHTAEVYDPFYQPQLPQKKFDFITCTEVLEHVFDLNQAMHTLLSLIEPEGHLAIMTELLTKKIDFKSWRYRNDDTHVCFFKPKTINWLSQNWNLDIIYNDSKRVVIFKV